MTSKCAFHLEIRTRIHSLTPTIRAPVAIVVAKCIAAVIARFFVEESCLCNMNNEYLQSLVDNDSQLSGSSPAQDDHAGSAFFVVLLVVTCMIWIEIIQLSNQFKHAVYCLSPTLKHMI
jgi:hypothetical protein